MTWLHKPSEEGVYRACGGCGATDPSQRCLGCFHAFGAPSDPIPVLAEPKPDFPVKELQWRRCKSLGPTGIKLIGVSPWGSEEGRIDDPDRLSPQDVDLLKAQHQRAFIAKILSALVK